MKIIKLFRKLILHFCFIVSRPFALAAYKFRQVQRRNRNYPIRWLSNSRLIAEDLLLINDEDGEEAINENFIKTLIDGREKAQKLIARYALITIGITFFLLMGAFAIELPVSVAGIQLHRGPGVNEMLLIVLSCISAISAPPLLNTIVLRNATKGSISAFYDDTVRQFHLQSALPEDAPVFYRPHYRPRLIWTFGTSIASYIALGFLVVVFLGIITFLVISRWLIYSYIYLQPSLPAPWTTVIVLGSLIIDIWAVVYMLLFVFPLPYRDYILLEKFQVLEHINPETAAAERSKAFESGFKDEEEMVRKGYIKEAKDTE